MNLLKNPQRLFFIVLATGIIILTVLSYFALTPIYDSLLSAETAKDTHLQFSSYYGKATMLFYVLLIFISNLIYKVSKTGIYLLFGWMFFSVFTLFRYIYMMGEHFRFIKEKGIWSGGFEIGFVIGFVLVIVAAIAAFINYAVLKRLIKN